MSQNKHKGQHGYAVVTKRGKIHVDTVCETRRDAQFYLTDYDRERGAKIKRVWLVLEG